MRNRFHAFPCTIVLSLVLSAASSQNIAFTPVELPDENLSGIITCITQDQRGNIWFTCNNSGLFEYDGIRLKSYMHDPLNPHSLANNVLECVYVDNDGYVWVGTYGDGLEKLDTKTGIFTDYKHDDKNPYSISGDTVTCILQDHEGTLWIGNDYTGLDRFDKKTGKFFHYKHKNNDTTSLSFDQVRALYEDREGTLWIGTGAGFGGDENPDNKGGLNRFNKSTGTFTQYLHNDKDPHSLIDNRVRAIYEDTYGNFWVGTSGDGLHTLNRATGKFTRYTYDPKHPERLSRPPVSTAISYDHITFITEDATRKIWIGTLTEGLTRYDPISKKIDRYKLHGTNFNNANDSTAWWAFTSSEGEMWISNFGAHMLRFDPFLQNISQDSSKGSLQSFFQESDSIEWIGTDGKGLARLDKKNNTIKWFVHDPKKSGTISSSNNVFTIYKDKENRLWVATDSGLNLFHPGKEIFSHYLYDPRIKTSISNNFVLPIYEDEKNDLWIGTALGLDKMNPSTGEFTHYKIYPQDSIVGGKNLVTCIAEDNNENLWTGNWSGGGVNLFDSKTHRFKNYLRGQSILGLCVTDNGILWAGSNINGVFRYDNALDSFHLVVDSANGDALAVVSMVKDHNDVWAGGPNGIFRIDGKTNAVARFSKSFGVNLPLNFLAAFKSEEGALIFGNTLGFYSFFPNKLLANNKPPQIVLTDFRTNNQQVQTGENNIFRDAAAIKSIKLNHNQNA
ncbi:MAG TPA: two-component regulator propeller domain-containing protein, partial [Parafilimonas sp.]|nr:two-component regulator propeller domain-containing protein [Parafilimonas sp.]